MKKVTISLFYKLIYQLRKKRSQWDTTDISLQKRTSKKEEMKTICTCGRKAICNCRKVNGQFVFEGEQVAIDLENDVQYVSMCPQCYFKARRAFYAARKN